MDPLALSHVLTDPKGIRFHSRWSTGSIISYIEPWTLLTDTKNDCATSTFQYEAVPMGWRHSFPTIFTSTLNPQNVRIGGLVADCTFRRWTSLWDCNRVFLWCFCKRSPCHVSKSFLYWARAAVSLVCTCGVQGARSETLLRASWWWILPSDATLYRVLDWWLHIIWRDAQAFCTTNIVYVFFFVGLDGS